MYYCVYITITITNDLTTACFDLYRSSSGYYKHAEFFWLFIVLTFLNGTAGCFQATCHV